MYNRYEDISKFILDIEQLCVADDGYVYISKEEDYGIAIDMESCYGSLDEAKPFIVFLAKHICELDNLVQRFNQKKRIKNDGTGYVCLPSPTGILRFDYLQSMENDPTPQRKEFPFELEIIYIEKPNHIVFDYWSTINCTQFDVTFEYKENKFFLRKYGSFDCIPDDWEETTSSLSNIETD
ncbi:MAG: hypothetical protein HFI34_09770 [Lachnospiraceae bacterium]|nr:hypothetical protein [Lachnospiraceae bacterium]